MVCDGEEPDFLCGEAELLGYLVDAIGEVMERDLWGIVRGRDFAILDVERTLGTTRSTYLVLADILEVGKDEDVWFVDY